jgi:L-ascorbate metabolism protein UlaG (beta-lactamase superfamily)
MLVLATLLASCQETAKKESVTNQPEKNPPKREATVWHLEHSGFAVKTQNFFLIFDYPPQESKDGLAAGSIDPAEIKDLNVIVFVSHSHWDHFNPEIAQWKQSVKKITYVISEVKSGYPGEFKERVKDNLIEMKFNDKKEVDQNLEIQTVKAIDDGVGYIVKVDGLTIFHGGDHALWNSSIKEAYEEEIGKVAKENVDIAFLAVDGGRQNLKSADEGAIWAIEKIKPKVAVPMHGSYEYMVNFVNGIKDEKVRSSVLALKKGETFSYTDGKANK